MLKAIQQFFNQALQAPEDKDPACQQQRLHLAAAALLIEIVEIEMCSEQQEQELLTLLQQLFDLDRHSLQTLVELARQEVQQSSDLYQFTRLINQNFNYPDKCRLIYSLWQVALIDSHLNKYEESTIRKIADLLHVSHVDFIKSKKLAMTHRQSS